MVAIVDDGKRLREIAQEKGMSESTVATHLQRIRWKLGARTNDQCAAIFAVLRMKETI